MISPEAFRTTNHIYICDYCFSQIPVGATAYGNFGTPFCSEACWLAFQILDVETQMHNRSQGSKLNVEINSQRLTIR